MARNIHVASDKDLIVAPATAAGTGAIAIVRMSGPGAVDAADRLLQVKLALAEPGRLALTRVMSFSDNKAIDQCLAVRWKSPHSYTGEDMVEFHLHGSPAIVSAVVAACQHAGARLAEPGEFTRRAFLNGKLDLAQAEAVAMLTSSQTEAAARSALAQLQGGLSKRLDAVRRDLVQVTAELEANVDYPDEELPSLDRNRLLSMVSAANRELSELLSSYDRGRRLAQGATVVFAGAPNAGKSSLFNALLRRERAIVTPHAGTTRDTLEAVIDLGGIPLTLVDTAGLRELAEEIEALGIQRTREQIETAELLLFVVDPVQNLDEQNREYQRLKTLPHMVLFNKIDALSEPGGTERLSDFFKGSGRRGVHFISATARTGLDHLEAALIELLAGRITEGGSTDTITSARHAAALRTAVQSLGVASEGIASALSPEFIVVDLATALSEIDSITGRKDLDEDILDAVFATFCLGK